ncbi:MAG TPA: Holliday junction branch migration protein RuvA [Bacteroidales bacterium]|nr:Holliday junction branch migration protein RuvA [Bacteroidales bacterium]
MFEYIKGSIAELTPAYVIFESAGIGYNINISLQTYSSLEGKKEGIVYLHQVVREDAHLLFGFAEKDERELFRLLISVSGVGANTARVILSSMSASEIQKAIQNADINALKQIKGIGLKTAQRIVVDLKDKVFGKELGASQLFSGLNNTSKDEALSALVMLGFNKAAAEKVLDLLLKEDNKQSVEGLIKQALKRL